MQTFKHIYVLSFHFSSALSYLTLHYLNTTYAATILPFLNGIQKTNNQGSKNRPSAAGPPSPGTHTDHDHYRYHGHPGHGSPNHTLYRGRGRAGAHNRTQQKGSR